MSPNLAELMQALPEIDDERDTQSTWPAALRASSLQPVPVGRWRRLALLSSLPAKIAAAYVFHWFRGWFKSADANHRLLAETHERKSSD